MRVRRPLVGGEESTQDLWASFTDITSTVALILFVLVLLAYVRNLISGKQLEAYQQQISTSEEKLRFLEDRLARTTAEIEAGQRKLKLSERKLDEQREVIAESNLELGELRSRLQGIAVLRVEVLEKVRRALETELGAPTPARAEVVRVGNNGNIVLNESLVFEYNSHAIKKEGARLLDTLSRALGALLSDPGVRENIDTILIQGHTDDRGSAPFNLDLSSRRANAVLNHLFLANRALEERFGSYFAASAHSEFRPLDTAQTEQAYAQNRRIEIAVVLKDSNVRRVIDQYMQTVAPVTP